MERKEENAILNMEPKSAELMEDISLVTTNIFLQRYLTRRSIKNILLTIEKLKGRAAQEEDLLELYNDKKIPEIFGDWGALINRKIEMYLMAIGLIPFNKRRIWGPSVDESIQFIKTESAKRRRLRNRPKKQ